MCSPESVQHDFVHVAPAPVLTRLDRLDDGVFGAMKMLGGMLVLGGIAAPDVPANEAHPQMNPLVPHLQTFFAAVCAWIYFLDLFDVRTSFQHCHCFSLGSLCPFTTLSEEYTLLGRAGRLQRLVDANPAPADSLPQTLRAADKWTAAFVESVQPMNVAGDADSDACADWACGPNRGPEPEFTAHTQIHAVIPLVDVHRLRKATGTAREVEQTSRAAAPLHGTDSLQGF